MKISVFYTGAFGEKVIGNLINTTNFCTSCGELLCDHCRSVRKGISHMIVQTYEFPEDLPELIDDPTEYIPENLSETDLILAIDLHPDLLTVLPGIARRTNASAVISPVERPQLAPPGLVEQVKNELENAGVEAEFPKPFCSLEKTGKKVIDQFVDLGFGRPLLKIELNTDNDTFRFVRVLRDAPCGSTWFVAKQLTGTDVDNYKETVSKAHHSYPCTASMEKDVELGDTILHQAGFIIRKSVEEGTSENNGEQSQ